MTQEEKLRKPEEIKKMVYDAFEKLPVQTGGDEKPSGRKEQLRKGEKQ